MAEEGSDGRHVGLGDGELDESDDDDGESISATRTTLSIAQLAGSRSAPSTLRLDTVKAMSAQRGERIGVIEEAGDCEVMKGGHGEH